MNINKTGRLLFGMTLSICIFILSFSSHVIATSITKKCVPTYSENNLQYCAPNTTAGDQNNPDINPTNLPNFGQFTLIPYTVEEMKMSVFCVPNNGQCDKNYPIFTCDNSTWKADISADGLICK